MSLINQMLVDLEKRKSGYPQPADTMLSETRPSHPNPDGTKRQLTIATLILMGGIAALGGWWLSQQDTTSNTEVPALEQSPATSSPLANADNASTLPPSHSGPAPQAIATDDKAIVSTSTILKQASLTQSGNTDRIIFKLNKVPDYQVLLDKENNILNVIFLGADIVEPLATGKLHGRFVSQAIESHQPGHLSFGLKLTQAANVNTSLTEQNGDATYQLIIDLSPKPIPLSKIATATKQQPTTKAAPVTNNKTTPHRALPATESAKSLVSAETPKPKTVKKITKAQQAETLYQKAQTKLSQQRTDEARKLLASALSLSPNHLKSRYTLAALLINQKHLDKAQALLREGLSIRPSYAPFAMLYGRLKLENNELAEAIQVMEAALINGKSNADYLAQLAALYQRQSRHGAAVTLYQQALRLRPKMGVWWMGFGISLEHENKYEDALAAYQRAHSSGSLSADVLAYVQERIEILGRTNR